MSTHNPWKTLGSKEIYKNPWIRVREDRVVRPDGKAGIYGVVETRIATGVVALTPEVEIYLVGQYRYPTEEYSWEIIEGGAEHGEDPALAIQRELREEAGLLASSWEVLGGDIHLSNCISSEVAKLYLAQGLSETAQSPDGTEVLTIRRVPFAEALRMVEEEKIKDAMSIIAIHRLDMLLRQGLAPLR